MTPRAIILLLLAIATLFAAANVGVGWLYALGFLFLSYFLLAFGLAIASLWGLRATLRPAERTVAGEGLSCTVALEHSGRSARSFLSLLAPALGARRGVGPLRGSLVPEGWGHAFVLEVRPGDRALVTLAFPATRRGEFRLPPLVVQAPAYGLGAVHRTVRTEATVLVRPRVVELPRLPWFQGDRMADLEDRSAVPAAGYELIRTIREYRPGDPLKSVHWRSTARTGELRIKETEGESSAGGVAIALDLGAGHTAETFEHAIVVAASLCAYGHGQGIAVTLYAQVGEPADQSLDGQLDWLARLPSFASLSSGGGWGARLGSHAVLITPAPEVSGEFARRVYVGAGAAPLGMIACPVGGELPQALGGSHGA